MMNKILQKNSLVEKIELIYQKLCKKKTKYQKTFDELEKEKYQKKIDKLSQKLVKKKIKLYKHEIINAKVLKQNGILIPLSPHDEGAVFTDEVSDIASLKELARVNNWVHKCLWIDFLHEDANHIIYLSDKKECV